MHSPLRTLFITPTLLHVYQNYDYDYEYNDPEHYYRPLPEDPDADGL
jgi:hypothetical protein